MAEIKNSPEDQKIESEPAVNESEEEEQDVSLDNLKDEEIATADQEDSDTSNS